MNEFCFENQYALLLWNGETICDGHITIGFDVPETVTIEARDAEALRQRDMYAKLLGYSHGQLTSYYDGETCDGEERLIDKW